MNHRSSYRLHIVAIAAIVGLAFLPASASATALIIPDTGILQISNGGTLIGITTSPNECLSFAGGPTCGTTLSNMNVTGSSSIFQNGFGKIADVLNGASEDTPFETVTGAGVEAGNTINFNLASLVVNTGATVGNCTSDAKLNSCTPANSPFTFAEDSTGTQVTISFTMLLSAYTGTIGSGSTPYRALFSTQVSGTLTGFNGCPGLVAGITEILSCEATFDGTITSVWSATESPNLTTTTPEPASDLLIGAGLIGVAALGRRLRRR